MEKEKDAQEQTAFEELEKDFQEVLSPLYQTLFVTWSNEYRQGCFSIFIILNNIPPSLSYDSKCIRN